MTAHLLQVAARSTMTATLENAAKNLLSDPPWMRVFKNTYDSIEDQLNKVDIVEDLVLGEDGVGGNTMYW